MNIVGNLYLLENLQFSGSHHGCCLSFDGGGDGKAKETSKAQDRQEMHMVVMFLFLSPFCLQNTYIPSVDIIKVLSG